MSESLRSSPPLARQELVDYLQHLDSEDFENFLADLWEERGWDTEVTPPSQDGGVDVVASRDLPLPLKVVIQAKRYGPTSNVSSTEIQQYSSLRRQEENVDAVAVITTGGFTEQAQQAAEALNVKLVDVDSLCELVEESNCYQLLEPYVDDTIDIQQYDPDDIFLEPLLSGDKTEQEIHNHVIEGYGLNDTRPVEEYDSDEQVHLVHSSPASPARRESGTLSSFDLDEDTTEHGLPVHLHVTTNGIWLFVRQDGEDVQSFLDFNEIESVEADSGLFGPNESLVFTLGEDDSLKYRFQTMSAEIRKRLRDVLSEETGNAPSL